MTPARTLLLVTLAAWAPQDFRTTAQFSVDETVLHLQSAVALVDHVAGRTWIHVYFYAFPLTPADVSAVARGSIATLEDRRSHPGRGEPDRNHSRAAMHLLVDENWTLSNASLEIPGLTCTFFEDPTLSKGAVQSFVSDGSRLQMKAKSSSVCDLTGVGGLKQRMTWDVDVNLPIFKKAA